MAVAVAVAGVAVEVELEDENDFKGEDGLEDEDEIGPGLTTAENYPRSNYHSASIGRAGSSAAGEITLRLGSWYKPTVVVRCQLD